jgi:flagellar motor protein MotB
MMRLSIFLLCFFAIIFPPLPVVADEPEAVRAFLADRQVVGQVFFTKGSVLLNAAGHSEITRLLPQLQGIDPDQFIIRVEGFATAIGDEASNVRISMQRAQAVAEFLSGRLATDLYVTGCGSRFCTSNKEVGGARADIVLYNNSLRIGTTPAQKISKVPSGREG